MPTYEFVCKSCEEKFSKKTSVADRNTIKCPNCSSKELQQVFDGNFLFFNSSENCEFPPKGGFG